MKLECSSGDSTFEGASSPKRRLFDVVEVKLGDRIVLTASGTVSNCRSGRANGRGRQPFARSCQPSWKNSVEANRRRPPSPP